MDIRNEQFQPTRELIAPAVMARSTEGLWTRGMATRSNGRESRGMFRARPLEERMAERLGVVRIEVDGAWDVDDLLALAEAMSESYGLFYPLVALDDEVRLRMHDDLRRIFWSGEVQSRHLGRRLYRSVPQAERLKLRRFSYESPGFMELGGILALLLLMSRVARSWIRTADDFLALWAKVEAFFRKRNDLRRPKRTTSLDSEMAASSDEARELVFEIGGGLGFDAISCDRLIEIVGNPIAALKYLVTAGKEGRKLAELQESGLLQLPAPGDDSASIIPTDPKNRGRRPGVEVVRKRRKSKK